MDGTLLFESAHALKGVCANLGLAELARAAGEITEEYRPGASRKLTDDEVRQKLDSIGKMYQRAVEGIQEYIAEA